MNYVKIYESFIADRRIKEIHLIASGAYCERHHIQPRSMGGGNDSQNIIALSPCDHYFAHCCLAKIYGGKMWFALNAMAMLGDRSGSIYTKRKMILFAREKVRELSRINTLRLWALGHFSHIAKSGAENGNHNPIIFDWINVDTGDERSKTIHAMWSEFGCSRGTWTAVQNGDRKTIAGWTIKGRKINCRGLKGKKHSFVNRDGRCFVGSQSEFCKAHNTSVASASRVCRHHDVTLCGWRLEGTTDRPANYCRDGNPGMKDKGNVYHLTKDGESILGTRRIIAEALSKTTAQISAGLNLLTTGKVKTYIGWSLYVSN